MNIATTIRDQIRSVDRMAFLAWGAKEMADTGNGLRFKTSGMTPWKGYVTVSYNEGKDLYDVEFARIRKMNKIVDRVVDEVYVEDLVSIIDDHVTYYVYDNR